jgi:methionyl-tRNA synthetase
MKKIDLVVGTVKNAVKVARSKKLLTLTVDLGKEERTIVAGVGEHYKPDDLKGKQIVVVANLEPATIMGIESNGMLLAASKGRKLAILSPERAMDAGSRVS